MATSQTKDIISISEPKSTEQNANDEPEAEPMIKRPKVPKKPKTDRHVAAKREIVNPAKENKPIPAPRTKSIDETLQANKGDLYVPQQVKDNREVPFKLGEVSTAKQVFENQPSYSSQFTRQSAENFDNNTGESGSQVQTFNFQQPKMADYDNKQPAPTGFLGWVGFGCSVFALACLCVSFASPYWMQTYPMSFNTFRNMGLWELCMHDYMHHKDDSQEIYNGCWWVFNREEKYWKLREWVLPPWFITCQVLVTMCLLCSMTCVIMIAMIFLHFCPIMNHEYHQSYAMFAASGLCFFITILTLIVGLMYGFLCGDRQWMPRPDLNFISWGYGFFIIQGIIATAAGVCYFFEAQKAFNELDRRDQEYTKAVLDLETSAYPASYGVVDSYGQQSYDAGGSSYSDQPPVKHSLSYHSQASHDASGSYNQQGPGGGYSDSYGDRGYPSKA